MDAASGETAIARFRDEYPGAGDAGRGHPALRESEGVIWSELPGCPQGIPVLPRGLLDREAAPEALRVLGNCLFNSIAEMSAAVPVVLPFLFRLADDPEAPGRRALLDFLVTVAELAEPVGDGETSVRWIGGDGDHHERKQCRAVFAASRVRWRDWQRTCPALITARRFGRPPGSSESGGGRRPSGAVPTSSTTSPDAAEQRDTAMPRASKPLETDGLPPLGRSF
ncbi:hypothetical protein ACFW6S_32270 [Streptomyces sp. NPDC058740]|uniref:hypothetical protein n=1 Tax=Streptomyces sp. NPDC058740 TaxID=3346619 RepID=UPI0036B72280